ncbi:MAG TPA: CehA/McbA family metallohydrolase, partial [Polyangiaceae bacterium]|nr:CehA/McbA family metallohydrolase [Polyangiaceae bacterium]
MRLTVRPALPSLVAALVAFAPRAGAQTLVLDGAVEVGGPDHQFLPFEVPAGTAEIEIRHDSLTAGAVIDWGLYDVNGFRGWSGGLTDPAVVGERAASRGYLIGPLPPGTWNLVIGKAKIVAGVPATYHVEIDLRAAPTLPPQAERRPYVPSAPLAAGGRWWPGDFHVHSRESGDANPTLDEVLAFAESRGLSFVEISDHNITSQLDFYNDAQARHPNVLLLPGVEFTTYGGHANGIGATKWVDHKIGFQGATIAGAAAAFRDQGAVFALNHAVFTLPDCIGCAWTHELDLSLIGAYEIGIGGADQYGPIFGPQAVDQWTTFSRTAHVTPIGGSDDHRGGQLVDLTHSPIGSPTTLVWAEELSAQALVEGVRRGRTVVKL